jgi:hypothetical protein
MTDIAGLSISVAAAAMYLIDAGVMYENAISGGYVFGASFPGIAAGGSFIRMFTQSVLGQNVIEAAGVVAVGAQAGGNSQIILVSVTTINALRCMKTEAMIQTSAAGTIQLMARTSVAGSSMSVRGGYIRAYRLI